MTPGLNKAIEDEIKTSLFLTDPYTDRERLVSIKGRRVAGTCEWIKEHEKYQAWLHNDIRLLWIFGGPGKGKTIISIFLSEDLEKLESITSEGQIFYYSCSHQDDKRNIGLTILRGLIWQMLNHIPQLVKHVKPNFHTRERGMQTLSSLEALWIIFRNIINDSGLSPPYCVLDGLDECDEQSAKLLISRLVELLSKNDSSASSKFRMAIVSRDIVSLRGCEQIKLDPDKNDKVISDIERFVEARVQDLSNIEGFNSDIRDLVTKTLLDRAEGKLLTQELDPWDFTDFVYPGVQELSCG